MKTNMYYRLKLRKISMVLLLSGCAATVPQQLTNARAAYARATMSPAAQQAPSELHKAKVSLDAAEQAFDEDSDSARARTLAYVAQRKAQLAQVIGNEKLSENRKETANAAYQQKQGQMAQQTKAVLAKTQGDLLISQQKEKDAVAALAKFAAVKEEQRGLVITLSGSVLFASDQSTLLPAAQTRLDQVAAALMANPRRNLIVEGHTDSNGSDRHNVLLSQQRADAVRTYLISRGYPTELVQSHGIGKDRPVATNSSNEGRANNRRVEIIVNNPAVPM